MQPYSLPSAIYIRTQEDLQKLLVSLEKETLLAIDTEANNIHAYQEQVCLIQISSRTTDYIVDPILIDDVSGLGALMENPEIEKIFHAAEYDVSALKRDFGFTFNTIFDTLVAARLCGLQNIGLAKLLEDLAGIILDKSHQRDDWFARPLNMDHLRYAQMDTHYLPYLRDELHKLLEEQGHLEEALELFSETTLIPPAPPREFDPEGFWKLGLPNLLKRREMLILKEIYATREQLARDNDLPPNQLISNRTLVNIAQAQPHNFTTLAAIEGMHPGMVRLYGEDILDAVRRGKDSKKLPPRPKRERPPAELAERYAALYTWRKEKAVSRGISADIIMAKQTLRDIAENNPETIDDLDALGKIGPWRLATYGTEIIAILDECRSLEEG